MSLYKRELVPNYKESRDFGDGKVLDIIATDQLLAGELELPPYSKAGYDGGHEDADEVFFVYQGIAKIEFPSLNQSQVVHTGSYIMMPRGIPHVVHNTEDEVLKLTYFQIVK
ncbi:cupin domain-containing protein [Sphaerochaeta halotolerans]|uniref:Cupin domain-containing protein n=1 Tax=Sphaerochaeta halotolerans TaxID=2293840 RepID=A0A372MLQ8_9SPIR|nr:cupin domain-containing protein [Sphaerochaeta halotolerans]RFU96100.1 cupin domain-containing protein [Sphaerochaeta halotolerans]